MKLVTHINPHLDDIVGIWLIKKYLPEFQDAKVEFISANEGKDGLEDSEDKIHVGVGMGKFDEHKGDTNDSAGSLVWKYLKEKEFIPKDENITKALDELVEWNRLIDLGKAPEKDFSEFSVQSFIRPSDDKKEFSLEAIDLGEKILERILKGLINKQKAMKDFEKRVEFESKFGKTIAIKSEFVDRNFCKSDGSANLYLMYDPKHPSVQFFTPSFSIDLEPIYKKLKELDPGADWFLHQSHHMVIAGSSSAPDSKKTRLSFEELVKITKSL